MENISEFQEDLRDLDFGNEELEIVQESYVALEKSYDILHNAKNPSHQAIQLHRIHVQSLADRLGVQMNTVAVEQFSPRTMHAFALEESEGFFAKIGKAIAAIFKWIKDAVVGIFRFIFGMSSGGKSEKAKATAEKAAEAVKEIKVEPKKDHIAKVTITATNEKGEQVTEVKELHGSLAVLHSFLQNPEEITNTFVTLFNLLEDIMHAHSNFSEKYLTVPESLEPEEVQKLITEIRQTVVDKMSFLESKYKFGTTSTGHKNITAFHTGRWDKPVDMTDPIDRDKNKAPKGEDLYSAFGFIVNENDKYKQSKSETEQGFTIDKSTFTKVKNALESIQDKIDKFHKSEKTILKTIDELTRSHSSFVGGSPRGKDVPVGVKLRHEVFRIENRLSLDTKGLVWELGNFISTIAKLQRSFYDLSMKVVKLSENHTQEELDAVMADKTSVLEI